RGRAEVRQRAAGAGPEGACARGRRGAAARQRRLPRVRQAGRPALRHRARRQGDRLLLPELPEGVLDRANEVRRQGALMAAAHGERPFDAARFEQSLRDVAAWVEVQGAQKWQPGMLRDPRLRPFPDDEYWPDRPRAVMTAAVDALVARRRALLADAMQA